MAEAWNQPSPRRKKSIASNLNRSAGAITAIVIGAGITTTGTTVTGVGITGIGIIATGTTGTGEV
jgi:hypothetical protein